MNWFSVNHKDIVGTARDDAATFVKTVEDCFKKCGNPPGFGFYQKTSYLSDGETFEELPKDPHSQSQIFYFNPVARECCDKHGLFGAYKGSCCDEPVDPGVLLVPTLAERKSSDEEREDWTRLSLESLARAYSDDEPDY